MRAMDDGATTETPKRASRFELAPPRHFMLPAILLLLSESPGYGYRLVKDLEDLRFGRIDRPTVYRTLGQLESDALVESWLEAPTAGQQRRVYGLTELGSRMLRAWMGVIKEERDALDRVLRRYQATATVDAVLAEVDGGWGAVDGSWGAALRASFSAVTPNPPVPRRHGIVLNQPDPVAALGSLDPLAAPDPLEVADGRPGLIELTADAADAADVEVATPQVQRYRLLPDRSVVLIEVRSSVGPISFGAIGVWGWIDAAVACGSLAPVTQPTAHLEVAVDGLRSGNSLYDAELLRRIDARRHPTATIDLTQAVALPGGGRYHLDGEMTFHGVCRAVHGTVDAAVLSERRLTIKGVQVFDIRDYDVPSPTVLMLRIYPDVRVHLHVEAELEG
jgi:DNA-binding PadR family transcriptional regulator